MYATVLSANPQLEISWRSFNVCRVIFRQVRQSSQQRFPLRWNTAANVAKGSVSMKHTPRAFISLCLSPLHVTLEWVSWDQLAALGGLTGHSCCLWSPVVIPAPLGHHRAAEGHNKDTQTQIYIARTQIDSEPGNHAARVWGGAKFHMFCQCLESLIMYSNLSVYFIHLAKNKLKSPSKSYIHAGYKLLLKVVVLVGSFILSTPF